MTDASLSPAAFAFDAIAPIFDDRFGGWASVAAQRRAVRAALLQQFPPMGHVLEVGGGTGEDAVFLAGRGFNVLLTDASPAMADLKRLADNAGAPETSRRAWMCMSLMAQRFHPGDFPENSRSR